MVAKQSRNTHTKKSVGLGHKGDKELHGIPILMEDTVFVRLASWTRWIDTLLILLLTVIVL